MKLIKRILNIKEKEIFTRDGDVNLTFENGYLMDCILTIYMSGIEVKTIARLNLELYRCGIYITHPELKRVIAYLVKEGLLSYGSFSEN